MKYDGSIDIATGASAASKVWRNKKMRWSELVQRLSEVVKTNETYKDYLAYSKEEQGKIKDVGGYFGGYLRAGRRKPQNVLHRQLITLDIDFAHLDFWADFQMQFDNAAVLHATHKHCEASPRFRLIIPLNRECSPDEYVAISRKIAGLLNIDLFDSTTFETNRLMFWGSVSKDMDYYFQFQDGPFVDADEILDFYTDWTDSSAWPMSSSQKDTIKSTVGKQEDPTNKKGIVGAFCRTYSITEAIEEFLPDVYTTGTEGRYTYVNGSTSNGLVIYDDLFAFSHHGTDPCSGKQCNAFDLVRIHKFGSLDVDSRGVGKPESYKAMEEFVREDKNVRKIIASENLQNAKYDFVEEMEISEEERNWMDELELDAKGKYLSTATNIDLIFKNDIRLKTVFRHNEFDSRNYVFATLPWRKVPNPEPLKNVDYSGVRNYFEKYYGISSSAKIDDSLNLEMEKNSYHPIKQYLRSLEWDKQPRVDTLLIDYFGTKDNVYFRESIRKMLVGAVARVINPGCKFDLVLVIVGSQGAGKSTFIKKLAVDWFSDTFSTYNGKEALEQLQGCWLVEMAELSGINKSEIETVKHFLTKQEDSFRPAYGRVKETFLRQCVFFGTTNNKDFLRDPSGNRRFMPVDANQIAVKKSIWDDLTPEEVDQIWAEAFHLYKKGEKLFLSAEAESIAKIEQRSHSEFDERKGIVEEYLNRLLPENWDDMDIFERRGYLEDPLSPNGRYERDYVCLAEIWCECLGKNREDMDRYKTREINDILRTLEEWEQSSSTRNFKNYGKQKYYSRKLD